MLGSYLITCGFSTFLIHSRPHSFSMPVTLLKRTAPNGGAGSSTTAVGKKGKTDEAKAKPKTLAQDKQLQALLVAMQKCVLQTMQHERGTQSVVFDTLIGPAKTAEGTAAKEQGQLYASQVKGNPGHGLGLLAFGWRWGSWTVFGPRWKKRRRTKGARKQQS